MLDNRSWFSIALMAVVATVSCGGKGISDGAAGAGVAGFDEAGLAGAVDDRGGAASGGASGGEFAAGFGGAAQAGSSGGSAGAAHGGSLGVGGTAHGGAAHGGAAHGGAAHGGAAGTSGAANSNLGAKCTSDVQCGAGMVCLSADGHEFSGGGPAGGLCTAKCNSQSDCDALEPGANCFNFGTGVELKLYCLEGCVQGGDAATFPGKCHGRADFACVDLSDGSPPDPYCVPLCRADAECGPGLYCSKSTGVCSSTKPSGDPVGTPCTPSTASAPGSENCAGFCLRTSADGTAPLKGVCAEFCAGLLGCGYHGEQPGGLCYGAFTENFGILDLGYCSPACDCTADCPIPGNLCRAWPAAQQSFADELGAPGLCVLDVTGSVALSTCGEAGAAGSAN